MQIVIGCRKLTQTCVKATHVSKRTQFPDTELEALLYVQLLLALMHSYEQEWYPELYLQTLCEGDYMQDAVPRGTSRNPGAQL